MAVDLSSFRDIIDQLGGVVIDVQNPVYDAKYPADDGRGNLKLYIPPGMQYMNGQQALAYARSRHATSDFDRPAASSGSSHPCATSSTCPRCSRPGSSTSC